MSPSLRKISDHLSQLTDTCNVYLVTDGDRGLLIDAGSGAILDHLQETGVSRIERVLQSIPWP